MSGKKYQEYHERVLTRTFWRWGGGNDLAPPPSPKTARSLRPIDTSDDEGACAIEACGLTRERLDPLALYETQ